MCAVADGIDDQIEIAVAIQVGQRSPGGGQTGASHPGLGRDVLELPVAEIPVEGVGPIQCTEVEVAPAIPIDVTSGDPRSVEENLVGEVTRLRQGVGEEDARG